MGRMGDGAGLKEGGGQKAGTAPNFLKKPL